MDTNNPISKIFTTLRVMLAPKESKTHDLSSRTWGCNYHFWPENGGKKGKLVGWTRGIEPGDYILLRQGTGTTRYCVNTIEYFTDPTDMFTAQVVFAPRPAPAV